MSGVLVGAWNLEIEGTHGTAEGGVGARLPYDPGLTPEPLVDLASRHSGTAHEIATDCGLSQLSTLSECKFSQLNTGVGGGLPPLPWEERIRGSRQSLGHEGKQLIIRASRK